MAYTIILFQTRGNWVFMYCLWALESFSPGMDCTNKIPSFTSTHCFLLCRSFHPFKKESMSLNTWSTSNTKYNFKLSGDQRYVNSNNHTVALTNRTTNQQTINIILIILDVLAVKRFSYSHKNWTPLKEVKIDIRNRRNAWNDE